MDLSLPGGAGAERGHWAAWLEGAGLQREGRGERGPCFFTFGACWARPGWAGSRVCCRGAWQAWGRAPHAPSRPVGRIFEVKHQHRKVENQIKMAKMVLMSELNKQANGLMEELEVRGRLSLCAGWTRAQGSGLLG